MARKYFVFEDEQFCVGYMHRNEPVCVASGMSKRIANTLVKALSRKSRKSK